jgi:hypothetical protein
MIFPARERNASEDEPERTPGCRGSRWVDHFLLACIALALVLVVGELMDLIW